MRGYAQFSLWTPTVLATICFSHIVIARPRKNTAWRVINHIHNSPSCQDVLESKAPPLVTKNLLVHGFPFISCSNFQCSVAILVAAVFQDLSTFALVPSVNLLHHCLQNKRKIRPFTKWSAKVCFLVRKVG